jgi:hypothetical protein
VACNFRCRRRLGIPLHVCFEFRARDLEEEAARARRTGERIASQPLNPQSAEYRDYLRSPQWEAFRNETKLEAGYRCEECGEIAFDVEVHHLNYDRLGCERREDVAVLCPACHIQGDEKRRAETDERKTRTFEARLEGWARKVFGPAWRVAPGFERASADFRMWLLRDGDR